MKNGKTMNNESRTKNSVRNIIFSVLAYLIQMVLGFFVRRYFIFYFNEQYLGLNSLFTNIISVLSLAEMGIGSAIVFAMFKPMAEGDKDKTRSLLNFYKKCYFTIGCVVLVLGLCIVPFMNYFKSKAPNIDVNLYLVYFIFLFNSVVTYFCAHRKALLYTSQRQDIESKINICASLMQSVLQLIIIVFLKNYYLYLLAVGCTNIINNLIVYNITNKQYKEIIYGPIIQLDVDARKKINKNVYAMLLHKIGGVIVFGTDSILIYLMIGASELGIYSNYVLITTYVGMLFSLYISAISGSIGNSIASQSVEDNVKLFKKLNMLHFYIITFCTVCIFVLANPFINTILIKDKSVSLIFDTKTVLIICLSFYLTKSRNMVSEFKQCVGLFYQDRFKPICEALINLIVSIILAKFWGIIGIILGTIASTIFAPLWVEPYVLNKYYLKQSTVKYFIKYIGYTVCMVVSGAITYFICGLLPSGGIWLLALRFLVCAIVCGITLTLEFMLIPGFKDCLNWIKDIIVGLKRKKQPAADGGGAINMDAASPIVDIDGDGIGDIPIEQVLTTDDIQNKDDFENKKTSGVNGDKTSQDEMVYAASKNKSANKTNRAGVKKTEKKKNS